MRQDEIDYIYSTATQYYNKGNYAEAIKYYRQIARDGHIKAMKSLGFCYLNGKGTDKSISYAIYWFKRVADSTNDSIDCYYLGTIFKDEKNYTDALKYFLIASNSGHCQATYEVGSCYEQLDEPAYEEAVRYYEKAIELGCEDAMYALGILYYRGKGVARDKKRAVELFELAAPSVPEAKYRLGLCYFNAEGTQAYYYHAIRLLEEASNEGISEATVFLDRLRAFEAKRKEIKKRNYETAKKILNELYATNPFSHYILFWEEMISKRDKRGNLGSWDKLDIVIKKLTDGKRND